MLVRLVKDWRYPDISRQSPGGSCEWKGMRITEDNVTEADILLVLNRPSENIVMKTLKGGAWLMSQESPVPLYDWHKKSFPYFDTVYTFWDEKSFGKAHVIHDQTSLPWHIGKNYDELKMLRYSELPKQDRISWITSNASVKEGHKVRMNFLSTLRDNHFDFDLFGRGFKPIDDKFDGIAPYKYSIAIENDACNDYWTEKLADCFLSWTLPFYYGCTNIESYFPEESYIRINPNNPEESIETMKWAVATNQWKVRADAIHAARELVLDKYQLFPALYNKIQGINPGTRNVLHVIPANNNGVLSDVSLYLRMKAVIHNLLR